MTKRQLLIKDSDYFHDHDDSIKLKYCPSGGENCHGQMAYMNNRLLLSQKFIENKEFIRAIDFLQEAFDSTFDLTENQCQRCAKLFRDSIIKTLIHLVADLEEMTRGLFRKKVYKIDLALAKQTLQQLQDKNKQET